MQTIYQLDKVAIEREAVYIYTVYGLDLLHRPNPGRGTELARHLRTWDGRLLRTLDEAVRALEAGEVMTCPVRPEWLMEM